MSQRTIRVNELIKREISLLLRTRFQNEAVYFTITDVETSPDLRYARVFYSVLGGEEKVKSSRLFFQKKARLIRKLLGKSIVLKYLPFLTFMQDKSIEQGNRLNHLMDQL
jgi:ribosome-binding factor A